MRRRKGTGDWELPVWYAGGVEAGSPGSRSDTPGHPVEGFPTPEGLQKTRILRTAFGVRIHSHAFPPGRRYRANPGLPASTPPALGKVEIAARLDGLSPHPDGRSSGIWELVAGNFPVDQAPSWRWMDSQMPRDNLSSVP